MKLKSDLYFAQHSPYIALYFIFKVDHHFLKLLYCLKEDVSYWYKILLLVIILLLNCYFGIFWFKQFIRQKTSDLLKNKYAEKYLSKILNHEFFRKKFAKPKYNIFDFDRKKVENVKLMMEQQSPQIP